MGLKKWEDLPAFMRCDEVRPYWEILNRKRGQIVLKRLFDLVIALILLLLLALPMGILALAIRLESKGPALYRQKRVTRYGREFSIHKFRTMVTGAERLGSAVTVENDPRITRIGRFLRHCRLDELPQLLDVLRGDMSFVGTRPEAVKYVERYEPVYYATLLMPAGITSEASIRFKDEEKLLRAGEDVDQIYLTRILPQKMEWNLESIRRFRFLREILTMIRTVLAVLGKEYS